MGVMFKSQLQSSNPALTNEDTFRQFYGDHAGMAERADVATVAGVVNKTGFLALLAVVAGGAGYALVTNVPSLLYISGFAAFGLCIGFFFILRGNPAKARIIAPIYAIVEGVFLGAFTCMIDTWLAGMGYAVAGGVALQAFIITGSILVAMLGLYKARILRPTKRFVSVVSVATAGIFLTYLVGMILGFGFGVQLPFISLSSAVTGGTAGLIGLGINVLILGVAALGLIIDFGMVEDRVTKRGPKSEEWYLAFALIVSLAWVYFEAVKLVFRLAILFGNRD